MKPVWVSAMIGDNRKEKKISAATFDANRAPPP